MSSAVLYMDALITPNRSLSRRGFRVFMTVLIVLNLAIAALFVAIGALPVPVFLGLDVLGVFIAFKIHYRTGQQAERVLITSDEVKVLHQIGSLARTVWTSPTAFTRVEIEDEGEHEAKVSLKLSAKRLGIGAALSPPERSDLAKAIEAAIRSARAERHA